MTVQAMITHIAAVKPHAYTTANIVSWINELEARIARELTPTYAAQDILRVASQDEYSLANGVYFEDVVGVYVDNLVLNRLDSLSLDELNGYRQGSTNTKIKIYPVPGVSDTEAGLVVTYISRPTAKLEANVATDTLMVPDWHSAVVEHWLCSKIDLYNRDYDNYNNTATLFNQAWKEYAAYAKRIEPQKPYHQGNFFNTW